MNKRPKSREETPKEGSDSARRYRTATICDRDAQKARAFESFPVQNSLRPAIRPKFNAGVFLTLFQIVEDRLSNRSAVTPPPLSPSSRIRDRRCRQKMH